MRCALDWRTAPAPSNDSACRGQSATDAGLQLPRKPNGTRRSATGAAGSSSIVSAPRTPRSGRCRNRRRTRRSSDSRRPCVPADGQLGLDAFSDPAEFAEFRAGEASQVLELVGCLPIVGIKARPRRLDGRRADGAARASRVSGRSAPSRGRPSCAVGADRSARYMV